MQRVVQARGQQAAAGGDDWDADWDDMAMTVAAGRLLSSHHH
jgi:hypothetical protein